MATQEKPKEDDREREVMRLPVPDGGYDVQSLGFIDRLLGDRKIRAEANRAISQLVATFNEDEASTEPEDDDPLSDPPEAEIPEAVPDGTTTEEKGSKPGESRPERDATERDRRN